MQNPVIICIAVLVVSINFTVVGAVVDKSAIDNRNTV